MVTLASFGLAIARIGSVLDTYWAKQCTVVQGQSRIPVAAPPPQSPILRKRRYHIQTDSRLRPARDIVVPPAEMRMLLKREEYESVESAHCPFEVTF